MDKQRWIKRFGKLLLAVKVKTKVATVCIECCECGLQSVRVLWVTIFNHRYTAAPPSPKRARERLREQEIQHLN